jgi:hypothetical protein
MRASNTPIDRRRDALCHDGSLVERKAMLERLLRRAPSEFGSDAAA